ncbi:hypothetical protein ACWENA_34585 [Streptomyces sp. NPDC004779]
MDVEQVTGELYGLRPSEFTAARDAYVAEARRAKDPAAAKAIAALRRPPLGVWAANLLARERPEEAERLIALGELLREAHRTLDGDRLREASRRQHQLVAGLVRTTAALAEDAGQPASDTVLADVERILHAVLALPDVAGPWAKGRLAAMPEAAVGFPAVPPGTPTSRPRAAAPRKEGDDRARAEPEGAAEAEAARAAAAEARAVLTRRERERDAAREAEAAARTAVAETAGRLRRAEREREEARKAATAAERVAKDAAEALRAAESALGEARKTADRAEKRTRLPTSARRGPAGA